MDPVAFASFMRLASSVFVAGLLLQHWIVFRKLSQRIHRNQSARTTVREQILPPLLKGLLAGALLAGTAFVIWASLRWNALGWNVLVGGEILIALAALGTGIQALWIRLAIGIIEKVPPAHWPRALIALRGGVLLGGSLYGVALWKVAPGTPGETLAVLLLLAGVFAVLGLNRTTEMPLEVLKRIT